MTAFPAAVPLYFPSHDGRSFSTSSCDFHPLVRQLDRVVDSAGNLTAAPMCSPSGNDVRRRINQPQPGHTAEFGPIERRQSMVVTQGGRCDQEVMWADFLALFLQACPQLRVASCRPKVEIKRRNFRKNCFDKRRSLGLSSRWLRSHHAVQELGHGDRSEEKRFLPISRQKPRQIEAFLLRGDQDRRVKHQPHFEVTIFSRFWRASAISRSNASASFTLRCGKVGQSAASSRPVGARGAEFAPGARSANERAAAVATALTRGASFFELAPRPLRTARRLRTGLDRDEAVECAAVGMGKTSVVRSLVASGMCEGFRAAKTSGGSLDLSI
ncbi:MAG: hypothetical protein Q7S40_04130 [Opitutaceae bacterium]|nr:hypothetical protein [Opitutaceae bacterium]